MESSAKRFNMLVAYVKMVKHFQLNALLTGEIDAWRWLRKMPSLFFLFIVRRVSRSHILG